jgi:hypothetical protein
VDWFRVTQLGGVHSSEPWFPCSSYHSVVVVFVLLLPNVAAAFPAVRDSLVPLLS